MTSERWRRACAVFERVSARPAEERAAMLAQACGDDIELRREVESLLANDGQASSAFEQLPRAVERVLSGEVRDGNLAPEDIVPEGVLGDGLVGARVGGHHIKSVIGRGAFSTVYEAVQESPHRVVALKVMKPDVPSRSALRRFQFESQTLARLRHPNIAHVYEAGLHSDGRPWFAMEFVPGARPITEYARRRASAREGISGEERARPLTHPCVKGRRDSRTSGSLDVRERLELFAQVCEAVEHGHQKGIIHRDLKPANILVDSAGQPKVIDFGVARATDSDMAVTTQQTRVGDLVGTVQYMSPEQCDADPHDVDTRSDVYSLGVVLYEMLTGVVPYDVSSTTIYNAVKLVKERDPADLSQLRPRLHRDVEAIVLKALAKDRARRYRSAGDMGADIRRYLCGDSVEARRASSWQRAVRSIGRHPVMATSLAWVIIALVIIATVAATDRFYGRRPDKIRPTEDKREVDLVARSGAELHTWRTQREEGFLIAKLVEWPARHGAHLIMLSFLPSDPVDLDCRGRLCAFDAADPAGRPVWTSRIEGACPRVVGADSIEQHEIACAEVFLEDVFDEHPGQEVIAVLHVGSASFYVVQIYALDDGKLLYQTWHDGQVYDVSWWNDAKLLVYAVKDQASTNDAHAQRISAQPDPRLVFAQKPSAGVIGKELIIYERGDAPNRVTWCLGLELPTDDARDKLKSAKVTLSQDPDAPVRGFVRYSLTYGAGDDAISFSWLINERGEPVGPSDLSDEYKRMLIRKHEKKDPRWQWLPAADQLRLVPRYYNPHPARASQPR